MLLTYAMAAPRLPLSGTPWFCINRTNDQSSLPIADPSRLTGLPSRPVGYHVRAALWMKRKVQGLLPSKLFLKAILALHARRRRPMPVAVRAVFHVSSICQLVSMTGVTSTISFVAC